VRQVQCSNGRHAGRCIVGSCLPSNVAVGSGAMRWRMCDLLQPPLRQV
jgi:hypothetical protein